MRLQQFPKCCGADILSSLEFDQTYVYNNNPVNNMYYGNGYYKKHYKSTGEKILKHIKRAKYNERGSIYAIANGSQRAMVTFLKKFGFKLVEKFYNPRHRSTLTMIKLNIAKVHDTEFDRLKKMVSRMRN